MKFFVGVLLFLAIESSLIGEIELVQMRWNAFKCLDPCVALVEQNLRAILAASDFQINGVTGTAAMKWDPKTPFSYEPFRLAAGAIGFKIIEMRVRVRGKVTHEGDNVFLISRGDGTRFMLIGPIQTQPGRYTPRYNLAVHPLTPQMKEQLLQVEKDGSEVLLSGPLYLPSHWSHVLIAEQVIVNPDEDKTRPALSL